MEERTGHKGMWNAVSKRGSGMKGGSMGREWPVYIGTYRPWVFGVFPMKLTLR